MGRLGSRKPVPFECQFHYTKTETADVPYPERLGGDDCFLRESPEKVPCGTAPGTQWRLLEVKTSSKLHSLDVRPSNTGFSLTLFLVV